MADLTRADPDLILLDFISLIQLNNCFLYIFIIYLSQVLKIFINSSETADGVNVPTSVNNNVINSGGV